MKNKKIEGVVFGAGLVVFSGFSFIATMFLGQIVGRMNLIVNGVLFFEYFFLLAAIAVTIIAWAPLKYILRSEKHHARTVFVWMLATVVALSVALLLCGSLLPTIGVIGGFGGV